MKKILYLVLSVLIVPLLSGSSLAQPIIPIISNYAGNDTAGYSGDGGTATSAQLQYPEGIATDNSGNLYIGDVGNHRIRKVSPDGIITTIGGNGTEGCSGDGGPATAAQLNARYIATDAAGNIYFCDPQYHRMRMIKMSGADAGKVTTIAGNGAAGFAGDGGFANAAQLNNPMGLTVSANGTIYVADNGNGRVRMIDVFGGISTIAGGGTADAYGPTPATAALLTDLRNIAVSPTGNIYICDGNFVRKISTSGIMTTVAGNADTINHTISNVPATAINLQRPEGIIADEAGNIYFAESINRTLRKVTAAGIMVQIRSSLPTPIGLARGPANELYVSEYGKNIVVKMTRTTLATDHLLPRPDMMTIFPNPTHSTFTINMPANCKETVNVLIQDIAGRLIQSASGKENIQIDLNTTIAPGMYIIKATGLSYNSTAQLIID